MGFFSFLFSSGNSKLKDAYRRGAAVIDVRTPHEFDNGHIPGALNIPVDRVSVNIQRFRDMKRPLIVCCDGGPRSSQVIQYLQSAGLDEIYYGGNWQSLWRKLQ